MPLFTRYVIVRPSTDVEFEPLDNPEYVALVEQWRQHRAAQPGYLGRITTVSDDGLHQIKLDFWETFDALEAWSKVRHNIQGLYKYQVDHFIKTGCHKDLYSPYTCEIPDFLNFNMALLQK